jgi:hypothetical protein
MSQAESASSARALAILTFWMTHVDTPVPFVDPCIYDTGMLEVPVWSQLLCLLPPVRCIC